MARRVVLFAALLFSGMLAGTAFVIWIEYDPGSMSAGVYTQAMQHAIQVFTVPLPILVVMTLLSTATAALLARRVRTVSYLFAAASLCILVVALVTVFGNIPINNQIKTWNPAAPPPDWRELSAKWWQLQTVRTVAALAGASLMILGAQSRQEPG